MSEPNTGDEMSRADSRLVRWRGIAGIGARRVYVRATRTESRQLALSLVGIAVSVALMLLVTSVALGLATGASVSGTTADYWVLPEGSASSVVTQVEGQQLGNVHGATARIGRIDGVTHATPLLAALLRVETAPHESEHVLVVGVIPGDDEQRVLGHSPAALSAGDPHYANGSYDGPRTGEAVLSTEAATVLGRSTGDRFTFASGRPASNRTFTVVGTSEGRTPGIGQLPVVLVHLSELQTITGAHDGDTANQILVSAETDAVEPRLESVYPHTTVRSRSERVQQQVRSAQLPLAIGASAFLIAVVIGTLFVVTTLGFELAADSRNRALLTVLGLSRGSLALLVTSQTLTVAVLGGLGGIVLWVLGVLATNALVGAFIVDLPLARLHPALALYGLGVAVVVGLCSVPALLVLRWRDVDIKRLEG